MHAASFVVVMCLTARLLRPLPKSVAAFRLGGNTPAAELGSAPSILPTQHVNDNER
jgi:hypothetical protein